MVSVTAAIVTLGAAVTAGPGDQEPSTRQPDLVSEASLVRYELDAKGGIASCSFKRGRWRYTEPPCDQREAEAIAAFIGPLRNFRSVAYRMVREVDGVAAPYKLPRGDLRQTLYDVVFETRSSGGVVRCTPIVSPSALIQRPVCDGASPGRTLHWPDLSSDGHRIRFMAELSAVRR